jgi:hypothetical protein
MVEGSKDNVIQAASLYVLSWLAGMSVGRSSWQTIKASRNAVNDPYSLTLSSSSSLPTRKCLLFQVYLHTPIEEFRESTNMQFNKYIVAIVLLAFSSTTLAQEVTVCAKDSDCAKGEFCCPLSTFVSRLCIVMILYGWLTSDHLRTIVSALKTAVALSRAMQSVRKDVTRSGVLSFQD